MTVAVEKLVRMAEQITANMAYTDDLGVVAAKVADHLNRFWDPRMRQALVDCAGGVTEPLSPALSMALSRLHDIDQPHRA